MTVLSAKQQLLKNYIEDEDANDTIQKYSVSLKMIKEKNVISLRKRIPSFENEGLLWKDLYIEAAKQNVCFVPYSIQTCFYHDKEYKEKSLVIIKIQKQ